MRKSEKKQKKGSTGKAIDSRNNYFLLLFAAMVMFMALPFTTKAQNGSASAPFPIRTAQQLTSLAQRINAGGTFYFNPADSMYYTSNGSGYVSIPNGGESQNFKLVADINLNAGDMASCDGVLPSGATAWIVLGNSDTHPFDGVLDGDYHTIGGMYVKQDVANVGFIGITGNHAKIRNLGIIRSYVSGDNTCGGLIGTALHAEVENCFFAGTVEANGTSAAAGTIVGGLIGEASTATMVSHCSTNAMVSGKSQVGGLVGRTVGAGDPCTFTNCYSSSTVYGQFSYTGGAIGEDRHSGTVISGLYYDSQMVSIPSGVAPASTSMRGTSMTTSAMTDGTWAPAGFTAQTGGIYPVITGFNPATNPAIYLTLVPIFLPAGSSLSNLTAVSSVTLGGQPEGVIWALTEGVGTVTHSSPYTLTVDGQSYVVLQASHNGANRSYVFRFDKTPLLGSAENPFTIDNLAQLTLFRDGINTGLPFKYKHFTIPALGANTCFLQTVDINMPNSNWVSIGSGTSVPFMGTYDGGNHAVIGWKHSTAEYAFFRYTDNATIKNLTMRAVRSTNNLGVLIYSMKGGVVDNCHAEGNTGIKGGLIYETGVAVDTAYILNSSNKNNIDGSGNVGGIVRQMGTQYNVMENCHNYGNVKGTTRVGGLVGWATQNSGATLTMTGCSNHGKIENYSNGNEAVVAGLVGSMTSTIQYSYNTGDVIGYYVEAGINAGGGTVSYCYNLGNITCGSSNNSATRAATIAGITTSTTRPTKCFNAGRVTNYASKNAYAISSAGSSDCFNVGEVIALTDNACAFTSGATRTYSLGRLNGASTLAGGTYYDASRALSVVSADGATSRTTAQMTTGSLFNHTNWVEEAGLYPRILGLDTLTISKALALPVFFGSATDNVDHVSANFTVANAYGIKWRIEGTSGATISDSTASLQKVTLPPVRTNGNIILAAYKGDSVYYRLTLVMAVDVPGVLTVDNLSELEELRTKINSGSAFMYKNTPVPACGEGATFRLTQNITMPTSSWVSIGTEDHPFKGTFDGAHHTLDNFKQSSRYLGGLFGYVEGTVKNVVLTNVTMTTIQYGGSICGMLRGGTVEGCKTYSSGTLTVGGTEYHGHRVFGGIVGTASRGASIKYCENYMHIRATDANNPYVSIGGIVGSASSDTRVDTCVNGGNISNGEFVAGICANGGKLYGCINYGNITGVSLSHAVAGISTVSVGGHGSAYITAINSGVYGCVNSGKVSVPVMSVTCYVGGVGASNTANNMTVEHSYNVGQISGNNATYVAGVAACGGVVKQSFNAGQVTGTGTVKAVTTSTGTVQKCFYDNQMCTAGDDHTGVTEKSTAEMCGTNLQADLGNAYHYENNMYPRIKGIENCHAS